MSYISKPFEELDVMDDFLMNTIANDPEIREVFCRTLVTSLLQCELGKIRITVQHMIPSDIPSRRGIPMDVEVVEYEDVSSELRARSIYDIE